jgi:hypothetical protein
MLENKESNIIQSYTAAASHKGGRKGVALQDNRVGSPKAQVYTIQRQVNKTGMPDALKHGIEHHSGISMDDVKVHYNSEKPSQLQAHAYAQGSDIHIAPGQEKHLPHEAWHVVQQKQGRVKPTLQIKGRVNVNDDEGLEKEADVMGVKSIQFVDKRHKATSLRNLQKGAKEVAQRAKVLSSQVVQRVIKINGAEHSVEMLKQQVSFSCRKTVESFDASNREFDSIDEFKKAVKEENKNSVSQPESAVSKAAKNRLTVMHASGPTHSIGRRSFGATGPSQSDDLSHTFHKDQEGKFGIGVKHQLLPQSTKKQAHRYDDDEKKEEDPGLVHEVEGRSATSSAQVFSPNEDAEFIIKQIGQEGLGECTIVSVVATYCANIIGKKILENASGNLEVNLLGREMLIPISENEAKRVNEARYRSNSDKKWQERGLHLFDYHMAAAYRQQSIPVEGAQWSKSHSGKTIVHGQGAVTAASALAGGPGFAHRVKNGEAIPKERAIRFDVKYREAAIKFIRDNYSSIKGVSIRRKWKYIGEKRGNGAQHGDHAMPVIFLNSEKKPIDPPYWIDQRKDAFPDNKINPADRRLDKIRDIVIPNGENGEVLWEPVDIIIIV